VNHIGHVVFASHLLPPLKSTASSGNMVRNSIQPSNAHEIRAPSTQNSPH
jgi:hypothetical protein